MKVRDIVSFSKDNFYNGAVQTEWYYDAKKRKSIAESYVFHGPKYYGVSQKDVNTDKHKLIDTASFAKRITEKLYADKPDNCFVMNIAGYGTGKSHLAVCLGALFSDDLQTRRAIATNIAKADKEIGEYVLEQNDGKNLVIVLNGMNNFNLDAEMLRSVRLALKQAGVSDTYLQKLTKSYDIARHFVENMYDFCENRFIEVAEKRGILVAAQSLKQYLLSRIETDSHVLQAINDVYEQLNGDKISWDRGLSAGDVLLATQKELCGDGKTFNKILILFDEFGRYIEYTAANPAVAGEAALQQIFEAIQNSNGGIIFTGFLQYELEVYLRVMDKESNIVRYVGRYNTASEKLFLSSNFETILANILKKNEPAFAKTVGTAVGKYERFHSKMQAALTRWDRSVNKKGVWTSSDLYKTVILKGCYPLHPITVWLLSGTHAWMQQRSTLAFTAEMFDRVAETEIDGTWLPYIYPAQVIDSSIFNEMLNSEEKGRVSSQYCMLYRDIITKIGDKLGDLEKTVLKAILVVNMGHMVFLDKADALVAIQYCSGLKEDQVNFAIKQLEDAHGVIAFDEAAKTFDFLAEASGFNEFQRLFIRHRLGQTAKIYDLDQETRDQLKLGSIIETSFGQENHISSTEWCFTQRLHASTDITEMYLQNVIRELSGNTDGEKPRGLLIYAYCFDDTEEECKRIAALHRKLDLSKLPILILLVDDPEKEILTGIIVKKTLRKFSEKDQVRFKKHIDDQNRRQSRKIILKFNQSVTKREMITAAGRTTYLGRLNALCTRCFAQVYTKPIPFVFDGFENKNKTQAKTALINLTVALLNNSLTNPQVYASLNPKEKNRIASALSTKVQYSWGVFDDHCQLNLPINATLADIMREVTGALEDGQKKNVSQLVGKYKSSPYGMNENAIALFVSYFIALHGNKYYYYYGLERLSERHWKDTKTGKFILVDFSRVFIQKNSHADVDAVAELCAQILANTEIEKCAQFKIKLNELIAQEGETESNRYKVAESMAYLEAGFRMVKSTREKLEKARNTIDAVAKKFDVSVAVHALELVPIITPFIEEGYRYEYSVGYKADVAALQGRLNNLLDRYLVLGISTVSCKITELSQMKSNCARMSKTLRDHGYTGYAEALEKRIEAIEQELLAKQKYESVLLEMNKDILMADVLTEYHNCCDAIAKLSKWKEFIQGEKGIPSQLVNDSARRIDVAITKLESQKQIDLERIARARYEQVFLELERDISFSVSAESYQECCRLIRKLAKWENFLTELPDLPDGLASSTITRVRTAITNLKNRKEQVSDRFYELARIAKIANSLTEIKSIAQKIKSLAGEHLEDEDSQEMVRILDLIGQAIHDIENLPRDIDGLAKYISRISIRSNAHYWQAMKACAMTEKSRLEKKQQEWINRYLVPAEHDHAAMSQYDCENWLKHAKELPDYLSTDTRKRYEKIQPVVENRLHKSRVDRLLAMYDGLTESEKRIFKQQLVDR